MNSERYPILGKPVPSSHLTPQLKLLLVEDDNDAAFLIQEMLLADAGDPIVQRAATLEEAFKLLENWQPSAIILDLNLPDSRGLDTFQKVHAFAENIATVVLTGHDDQDIAIKAVQQGAEDYLLKGHVDGPLLMRAIRYAVERSANRHALLQARSQLEERVEERTRQLSMTNERLRGEIHERSKVEEALRESNLRLEEALQTLKTTQQQIVQRERLHALGNMASGVAHDFNNALAPILGFTDLLLKNREALEDHARVTRYLELMRACAQNAAGVVKRLREFYRDRNSQGPMEPLDLNALIETCVNMTKPKWSDEAMATGVSIQVQTDLESVPPVLGSPGELQEVLTNLIFNAVESMSLSGTITIRTRLSGDAIVMHVIDTGSGMSEEVRRRCMDPFFSTKGHSGSGFGLPTAFGILERHSGSIDIESQAGGGTTVTVRIPTHGTEICSLAESVLHESEDAASPKLPASGPLNILIVDDEPLLREVVTACLMEGNHTVKSAEHGREALELFRNGTFDLVITDRAMPGMSGDQLARELKGINPELCIIMLTGFGDLMDASHKHVEGIDLIIGKPFTVEDLLTAVDKMRAKIM